MFLTMENETVSVILFGSVQLIISIIATWKISNWYHNKKSISNKIWESNRKDKLESLKRHVGQSYSMFNEKFNHLMEKNLIVEQDLVSYNTINYDQLISALQNNQKITHDDIEKNLKWMTGEEFWHHADMFRKMLWFIMEFKNKSFTHEDIERVNILHKQIKLQSKEYLKYTHVISGNSTLSRNDSLRAKGIKYFKSSIN